MEVAPPPTVEECCEWVSDNVLALETDDDVAIELDSLSILVNALDAPMDIIEQLQEQINDLKKIQKTTLLDDVASIIPTLFFFFFGFCGEKEKGFGYNVA